MAKNTVSSFQSIAQAMQHEATILQAWRDWFRTSNFVGDPDTALRKVQPSLWRAFCRSKHAAALGVRLPEYDRSMQEDADPVPATGNGLEAQLEKLATREKTRDPFKDLVPCPQCSMATPRVLAMYDPRCEVCRSLPDPGPAPDPVPLPVPDPVPVPVSNPVPVPETIPVPVPVPAPDPVPSVAVASPANPLMQLIAQGLQEMGFKATPGVSGEEITRMVGEAVALAMAEYTGPVSRVDVTSNGAVTGSVTGYVPSWFSRLCKLHAARVPALLVGPAGSGKTTAVAKLAEAVGVPFYRLSLAAGTDEGEFVGRLLPTGENMQFNYVYSLLTKAYTEGGIVLADDIDLGDANTLGILNAPLDGGGWFVSARHTDPFLEQHPDFYLVACANTHGHGADRLYVGAQQLDERTLSRFRMGQINCDYDPQLEQSIFPSEVVETGHLLRARCRALPGWGKDISTRDLASVAKLTQVFSLQESWYGYFADWSEEDCHKVHVLVDHATMTMEIC